MRETAGNVMNEKDLQMIKELRLMDDDFFSEALDGKKETVIELALKMLARGRDSIEEISEMTGLSLEEVRELAKKEIA